MILVVLFILTRRHWLPMRNKEGSIHWASFCWPQVIPIIKILFIVFKMVVCAIGNKIWIRGILIRIRQKINHLFIPIPSRAIQSSVCLIYSGWPGHYTTTKQCNVYYQKTNNGKINSTMQPHYYRKHKTKWPEALPYMLFFA